jgi:hypothetical protein
MDDWSTISAYQVKAENWSMLYRIADHVTGPMDGAGRGVECPLYD